MRVGYGISGTNILSIGRGVSVGGGGGPVDSGQITMITTSTSATWSPQTVTKTGGTLTWSVYDADDTLLVEQTANKPTLDLSGYPGTKTIRVTSPDGWGGLTTLEFTSSSTALTSIDLRAATGLTQLYLRNQLALTWTIDRDNPMPPNLTNLHLRNISGISWSVDSDNPMPPNLTRIELIQMSNVVWSIDGDSGAPDALEQLFVLLSPNVTVSDWSELSAIHHSAWANSLDQAEVDAIIAALYADRFLFTHPTPSINLASYLGAGTNAAPSGTYQYSANPTTGLEMIYALVENDDDEPRPNWTITYTAP